MKNKRYFVYGSPKDGGGWNDFTAEFDDEIQMKCFVYDKLEEGALISVFDEKGYRCLRFALRYDGLGQS
jgi:hypothetical protein